LNLDFVAVFFHDGLLLFFLIYSFDRAINSAKESGFIPVVMAFSLAFTMGINSGCVSM
jgi:hypothetical protein